MNLPKYTYKDNQKNNGYVPMTIEFLFFAIHHKYNIGIVFLRIQRDFLNVL